nr:hypothetical protein [Tanacetum cinerariifolium]
KKVVITEAAIREVLRLDDAEGGDCLPNEEIFAELAHIGVTATRFVPRSVMLGQIFHKWNDVITKASFGDDAQEPSIPTPTLPTPPTQQPQDLPSTSQVQHSPPQSPQPQPQPQPQAQQQAADFSMSLFQEALDAFAALTRRVEHLKYDKVAQALEITKLKKRRIDTSEDTVMGDASNQERMIDDLDNDDVVALMDDKEEDKEEAKVVLSMQEDEPAEVHEVVDVATIAKLITEVVTAASETVTAASIIIFAAEPQVPAATITAAPVRVVAASTRRRK